MAILDPYEPQGVLKPVADDIWIVDGPIVRFDYFGAPFSIPFSTRMTIVRLANGSLWVHSPVVLTPPLKQAVDALGPVAHIVSPNRIHTTWMEDWNAAYPTAVAWGAPGRGASYDRTLGTAPESEWATDLDQLLVPGGYLTEAVFFHRVSRTLILTDLIQRFEARKVRSAMFRLMVQIAGAMAPRGGTPFDLRMTFLPRRREVRRAVQAMPAWQPERIVLAHGAWIEHDAAEALRRAPKWAL